MPHVGQKQLIRRQHRLQEMTVNRGEAARCSVTSLPEANGSERGGGGRRRAAPPQTCADEPRSDLQWVRSHIPCCCSLHVCSTAACCSRVRCAAASIRRYHLAVVDAASALCLEQPCRSLQVEARGTCKTLICNGAYSAKVHLAARSGWASVCLPPSQNMGSSSAGSMMNNERQNRDHRWLLLLDRACHKLQRTSQPWLLLMHACVGGRGCPQASDV